MLNRLFSNLVGIRFYAPPDNEGGGGADEIFELLSEEEIEEKPLQLPVEKKEEVEKPEAEVKVEAEVDELKEIEEELEGPSEEDLELMTPVRRKEILAKYPKLFKDFPYLEKAYYREQQFTELLPTIQDAKIAVEKARILERVEQKVLSGDISEVLQAAKHEDQEAFLKIADNYLPALRQVDQQAYFHVLGNVIKDTIITMVKEGRVLGEQGAPLTAAANILNQFVFGSQTFQPPSNLSKQTQPEDQSKEREYQLRERQRTMSQFQNARDDLQSRADNVLMSTIDQHIDPNKSMTDYVRKNANREAFETLEDLMSKDSRFRGLLDRLWEKAFQNGFDRDSTEKIKSAYLSKAKTLLPSVIKKARNDALKGLGKRSDGEADERMTPSKSPIIGGRSTSPFSGKIKSPADIPKGMSTFDVLMKD